jgi:hypothetical protein
MKPGFLFLYCIQRQNYTIILNLQSIACKPIFQRTLFNYELFSTVLFCDGFGAGVKHPSEHTKKRVNLLGDWFTRFLRGIEQGNVASTHYSLPIMIVGRSLCYAQHRGRYAHHRDLSASAGIFNTPLRRGCASSLVSLKVLPVSLLHNVRSQCTAFS